MRKREVAGVCFVLSLALLPGLSRAKVSGQCGNCHIMHNSQDGAAVAENRLDGAWVESQDPNPGLLKTNCIGCHLGANSGGAGVTPYVLQLNEPTYNSTGTEADTTTLAGGSFYWVGSGQEAAGHNVDGLAPADGRHGNLPPGGADLGTQLTCAGSLGCHGDRTKSESVSAMLSSHHYNDMTLWKDGTTLAKSYRFLYGVKGFEDTQYEYRPTAVRHNKYYGVDRSAETEDGSGTVGKLCAECHGDFHGGAGKIASGVFGAGVWLRHPTNFDMGTAATSSEYASYNGGDGTDNTYSVISPVGTTSTTTTVNSTVYSAAGDAIVMCLSCHRAHGTKFAGILRWDYKSWPAGGYNGCAVCHATKD